MLTGAELTRLVELSEARAYARLLRGAPMAFVERFGLDVVRMGSAYALVAAAVQESLLLNRVIGLGVCEPAGATTGRELDDLYAARGVATYALEIGPHGEPPELTSHVWGWGFVPFKQTAMLYRRVEPIQEVACDLSVRRAGPEHAGAFAALCCRIFGFGEPLGGLLEATFDHPAWRQWLTFDGDLPVGAAITHVEDDVAWIGWVGTLPEYRRRGAQHAITRAQLEEASAIGCRWVTLETETGTKKAPSQSLRNYRRLGWTPAYNRVVYVRKRPRAQTTR